MNQKRESFTVRRGHFHARISPRIHNGKEAWRFGWHDGTKWRYVTRFSKAAIRRAAVEVLDQQETGFVFTALPAAERRFLAEVHRNCPAGRRNELLSMLESWTNESD